MGVSGFDFGPLRSGNKGLHKVGFCSSTGSLISPRTVNKVSRDCTLPFNFGSPFSNKDQGKNLNLCVFAVSQTWAKKCGVSEPLAPLGGCPQPFMIPSAWKDRSLPGQWQAFQNGGPWLVLKGKSKATNHFRGPLFRETPRTILGDPYFEKHHIEVSFLLEILFKADRC